MPSLINVHTHIPMAAKPMETGRAIFGVHLSFGIPAFSSPKGDMAGQVSSLSCPRLIIKELEESK